MVNVVSLFAGCGGSDVRLISCRYKIFYANGIRPFAKDVYLENLPENDFELNPIENIEKFPTAPLLIGCYPCQGFSQGGHRDPNRKINRLYLEFDQALKQIRPKAFIVENASGMAKRNFSYLLHNQLRVFREQGYRVTYDILDASDFGVPQGRKRIFPVGIREDLGIEFYFPTATYGNKCDISKITIRQAISSMPEWPLGEFYDYDFHWYYLSRNSQRN